MSLWDFARDPASVLTLLEVGKERAVDEQVLLQGTRLKRAQLDDPNSELSAAQEMRVIANLLKELGHPPSLGLEIGLRCHFTSFGMWGYGLIASASLGAAVDLALRYLQLTFAYCVIEKVIRGMRPCLLSLLRICRQAFAASRWNETWAQQWRCCRTLAALVSGCRSSTWRRAEVGFIRCQSDLEASAVSRLRAQATGTSFRSPSTFLNTSRLWPTPQRLQCANRRVSVC